MTVQAQEITRRVQSIMGDEAGTFIQTSDVYDWINDAQAEIAKLTECMVTNQSISTIANIETYALNDMFLKIIRVTYNGTLMNPVNRNYIDLIDPNRVNTGSPTLYYMEGISLVVWPRPTSVLVNGLAINYIYVPALVAFTPTTTLSIPDLFREDVVRYCHIKARMKDESPEYVQMLLDDWRNRIGIAKNAVNNPHDKFMAVQDFDTLVDYPLSWNE